MSELLAGFNFDQLIRDSHQRSARKGWWDDPMTVETVPSKIALMHSELSEALTEYRDSKPNVYFYAEDARDDQHLFELGELDSLMLARRGQKPEGLAVEFADTIIRICDLAGKLGIDLDAAIRIKAAFNETRPHKHGGKKV